LGFFRKLYRAALVGGVFAYSLAELLIQRPRTRPQRAAWLSGLCQRLLRSMEISVTHTGPVPTAGAVISNHLTYVDILLHSALHPCVFVSKAELRRTPLFGWISMMAGTVYVERGAGGSAQKAAQGMAKGFRDGLPVVFFPEGTTFVGDEPVMPFHSGLLAQALAAGAPVTAAFVRYRLSPVDERAGKSTREDVHWGPQTLPAHLWNFMGLHNIDASIRFAAAPISFSPQALSDRKTAAVEARRAVLDLSADAKDGSVGC
jgi:1-acyl-sn-glycerol-3-phosphate acyltransferase